MKPCPTRGLAEKTPKGRKTGGIRKKIAEM
jgi:hypothetical protein